MVHVQQRQMVAIDVREAHLSIIGRFLHLVWSHEALWNCGEVEKNAFNTFPNHHYSPLPKC